MGFLNELTLKYSDKWNLATQHKFLEACKDGTLPREALAMWASQEIFFAVEFTRLVAATILRTPPSAHDTLTSGLETIVEEKAWFRTASLSAGQDPDASEVHPACAAFVEFVARMSRPETSTAEVLTAFWAMEAAYKTSWEGVPSHAIQEGLTEKFWTNPKFLEYVAFLQGLAEDAIEKAGEEGRATAERTFLEVCDRERDFWKMTYQNVPENA